MTAAAPRQARAAGAEEQHYVPGGYTHTFGTKGYVWDVGYTVGEVTRTA